MFSPRDDSSRRWGSSGGRSDGRGQSELVAVVLLLLIVVLGSIVVAITGVGAIEDNKRTVDVSQAETSLQQLDSRSSDVTLGFDGDTSQVADLQRGGGSRGYVTDREAWIRIQIRDTATDDVLAEVVNEPMGSVVYRRDDTTIALEGGGVWRSDGDGTVMISPPEFNFRDGTLTLPVVDISGDPSLSGPVRVTRNGPPERKFPVEGADPPLTNRLTDGKVIVTVHSDYYRAWGQFFEDTTNAYVTYDDGAKEVNAVFLALPGWGSVRSGIIATSGSGELWLKGNGAYVDSYDSSEGPYSESQSDNGLVEAAGDVTLSGDSDIQGDVRSGDVVELQSSSAALHGDVYWTTDFIDPNNGLTGTDTQITGVDTVDPIDGYVDLSMDIIRAENDNDDTGGVIQDDHLVIAPKGSAELGAGSYYLDDLTLVGQELTLDTTEGDIFIGVRDYMSLTPDGSDGAKITVKGDGIVRIFVLSEATTQASGSGLKGSEKDVNLHVGQSSSVYVPGDRSPQLRLYGNEDLKVAIGGSESNVASFTGVIYAPAGLTGPSRVYVKKADVYGQIVTANLTLGQDGKVHYDLALQGVPLPRSPLFDRLEFMHVAVHKVKVEDR